MLVDVDWVSVSMTDVRLLINGSILGGYLNTHLGGLRHLGIPAIACFLWTATQAQRDHEIIHARNFRVQPQAIMGSSIVD